MGFLQATYLNSTWRTKSLLNVVNFGTMNCTNAFAEGRGEMLHIISGTLPMLLFAYQAPYEPSVATEALTEVQEEIVVIGKKLNRWRARVVNKNGIRTCKTLKSTKDRDIDAIGCNAMLTCIMSLEAEATSLTVGAKSKKEAATLLRPYYSKLGVCVRDERARQIAALAKSRNAFR
jgi:hypothetical protein